jgi:hypothetical protein
MNWGGFAGGFAQGLNQTFDAKGFGRYLMSPERRMEEIAAKGAAEANAARDAEIAGMVKENGITGKPAGEGVSAPTTEVAPAPQAVQTTTPQEAPVTTATPTQDAPVTPGSGAKAIAESALTSTAPTLTQTPPEVPAQESKVQAPTQPITPAATKGLPFTVGDKSFATREEAQAHAAKNAPSVMDFMYKTAFPKMQEAYIAKGDIESADRLQKYVDSKRGKDAITSYGKAMNKLMFTTDVNGAVQALGDYYTKYVDDGVDFTKGEITPDGKISITTKNKESGKEDTLSMSRNQLLQMGMAYNPAKLLEMNLAKSDEAEKATAKTAAEIAKENRVFNRDIEKMTIEKQLEAANSSSKFKREVNAKVDALRSAGYSDDFINGAMPGIIGVGDYKKMTSPEEARRLAHSDRMKNDPVYARKSGAEQSKMLDQDMTTIYSGVKPSKTPGAEAPSTPSAPANGLPKTGGKGIPVFDTKTGTIVYR